MRHSWLHATALTLSLCACAAAQQGLLVRQDDSGDPCRRFKMRVLMPAEPADQRPRPKGTAEGLDQKMVWNPCRADEPQLVLVQPAGGNDFFAPPRLMLEAAPAFGERGVPSDSRRPRPARGFDLMRKQQ